MKRGTLCPRSVMRSERGWRKIEPVMPAPPQPGSAAGAAQPKPDAAWVAALALVEPLCRGRDVLLIEGGSGAAEAAERLRAAGAQRVEVLSLEAATAGGRAWDVLVWTQGAPAAGRVRALAALLREGGLLV